ncbi:MAG: hypothetical protein GXP27_19825 [Planctomycetes bacterium]|nr:hypothetical protein [Planctomycetota bacterium]
MLNLVAGPAESSPRRPAPAVAAAIQQQASEVCHEVRVAFPYTGAGRLIARKAGEVSRLADYFLRAPTCCNHRRARLYLREMKDLVDEMEDLADSLRRRRPPVRSSRHIRFGTRGFEVFIGETETAWCGGCGRCDCCRRLRRLRQAIECLEDLVRELDRATRRCPCCGRLRSYDPPARPDVGFPGPPRPIPDPSLSPDVGYWPGSTAEEETVRWQRMAQLWLSLALD